MAPKYEQFVKKATWQKSNGKQKQVSYMLMEYVDGIDLHKFFKTAEQMKSSLTDKHYRYVSIKIAKALSVFHNANVAHRDIKL